MRQFSKLVIVHIYRIKFHAIFLIKAAYILVLCIHNNVHSLTSHRMQPFVVFVNQQIFLVTTQTFTLYEEHKK